MRKTFFQLFCSLTVMAWVLSSCNLPVNNSTSESQTEVPAAIATATKDLAATQTSKALPTDTPTLTPTETLTPEPSATSTPELPKAKVVRETNCRIGPGGMYDKVATYQVDTMLVVVAADLGGGYWFVQNPDKPEEQCYLLAQNVRIEGDTATLPKYTPMPSPTAVPDIKVSFRKFDTCQGKDFAAFIVENIGNAEFRSVYIRMTDLKVDKSVETALNAFDQHNGCVLVKNISPLEPGSSGYVETPPITWNARGHRLRVTIMTCTDPGLKGTCVTKTIEVKE